jgi:Papain family cysteine protease
MAVGPHLLGRVPSYPDERDWTPDQLHRMARMALELSPPPLLGIDFAGDATPAWEDLIQLDQGQTGHCVGFGWAGWGDATPVTDTFQNADGDAIYYECKVIDGEPLAETGSNVRSGAKAMQNRQRLTAYAFATDLAQVDEWLNNHGPVVFGSDWYHDMFTPDPQGWVTATGTIDGGHCFLCLDKLDAEDGYLFQNSWGSSWGLSGRFKIKSADLAMLLASGGEACLAAESPLPGPIPPPEPVPPGPAPAPAPPIPAPIPIPPPPTPAPAPSGCLLMVVALTLLVIPLLARIFG